MYSRATAIACLDLAADEASNRDFEGVDLTAMEAALDAPPARYAPRPSNNPYGQSPLGPSPPANPGVGVRTPAQAAEPTGNEQWLINIRGRPN